TLHDQAGVDQVVALAADQQAVGEGDHPGGPAALLERLVALEAIGRAVDRRRLRLAVRDGEDVALGRQQDVDGRHVLTLASASRPVAATGYPVLVPTTEIGLAMSLLLIPL